MNAMTKGHTSAYPTPGTLNAVIQAFFAASKDQYKWEFSTSDFNFDGVYNGFFKAICKERMKKDVSTKACHIIMSMIVCLITYLSPQYLHSHSHISPPSTLSFLSSQPKYSVKSEGCQLSAADVKKIDISKFGEADPPPINIS